MSSPESTVIPVFCPYLRGSILSLAVQVAQGKAVKRASESAILNSSPNQIVVPIVSAADVKVEVEADWFAEFTKCDHEHCGKAESCGWE